MTNCIPVIYYMVGNNALLSRSEQQKLLAGAEIHFVNTTNVTY